MILFTQAYSSTNAARQRELEEAARINSASGLFQEIVALDGNHKRWTFGEVFAVARETFPKDVCVIANSDISFHASMKDIERLFEQNTLPTIAALTRWEDGSGPLMVGRIHPASGRFFSHTQDTWAFVPSRLPQFDGHFFFGLPCCENRLAFEAAVRGIRVVNPALTIRTFHHHASGVRGWSPSDSYRGSVLFPQLTTLDSEHASAVVAIWNGLWHEERIIDLDEVDAERDGQMGLRALQRLWRLPPLETAAPVRIRRVTSG
jgi:hypothetical protein